MKTNWGKVESVTIHTLIEDYAGYDSGLYGQHGISLLLDIRTAEIHRRILFDTGQAADPVLHNMKQLNLDPRSIDMIFLSHCHYDHTGGLTGMLRAIGKSNIPVIAHPALFRTHIALKPSVREMGMTAANGREKIEECGGKPLLVKSPFPLLEGVISTGEITERRNFEEITLEAYTLENSSLQEDELKDDMSLILRFPGEIIIVAGCSHAGIVGITEQARRITGEDNVYALIGGFHLLNAEKERIRKTVAELRNLGVEKIYTGHCTGLKAECEFMRTWGADFEKLHSGKTIRIIERD